MINVSNVTFSYGFRKAPVLNDFSLSFSESGVYGLLGSNGVGKSTLLYILSGMLTPDSGEATYLGINTRRRLPMTVRDLMLVPEEFDLPSISLSEYVRLTAPFYPGFSQKDMERNLTYFELEADVNLNRLSMGQKKKAILAFAFACHTRVLLMDEPTNGLDIPAKSAFRRVVAETIGDDQIIVISTHQVRDVGQILDHVVIMDHSRVLLDQPMMRIEDRLRFVNSSDKETIGKALYSEQAIGGASLILPSEDSPSADPTEVNLEMLFNFAISQPEILRSLF